MRSRTASRFCVTRGAIRAKHAGGHPRLRANWRSLARLRLARSLPGPAPLGGCRAAASMRQSAVVGCNRQRCGQGCHAALVAASRTCLAHAALPPELVVSPSQSHDRLFDAHPVLHRDWAAWRRGIYDNRRTGFHPVHKGKDRNARFCVICANYLCWRKGASRRMSRTAVGASGPTRVSGASPASTSSMPAGRTLPGVFGGRQTSRA